MRFAEVFLRLGCSLVAWMVIYTYVVWLAALHVMGCGPDGNEMHQLLLGLAPVACLVALMLRLTRPFPDIHRMLGWLGAPILLLLVLALRNIWQVFERSNLQGLSICFEAEADTWQVLWAPAQLVAVAVIFVLIGVTWREARRSHD